MPRRKQNKNIFLLDYSNETRLLIHSKYEDEILTEYFELGYDEKDMKVSDVAEFLIGLRVPEILIVKYKEFDSEKDFDLKFRDLIVSGLEEEQIVDFDKLVFLAYKFIVLRDNYQYIEQFWSLFINYVEKIHEKNGTERTSTLVEDNSLYGNMQRFKRKFQNVYDAKITFPDLKVVIHSLKLNDKINDGVIIDMIANGSDSARPFVNFFDFAMLMGKMEEIE